jgi:hypothetical protein
MIAKKKEGLKQREPGKKRSRIDQEQRSHRNATVCSPQHSHLEPSSTIAKKPEEETEKEEKANQWRIRREKRKNHQLPPFLLVTTTSHHQFR